MGSEAHFLLQPDDRLSELLDNGGDIERALRDRSDPGHGFTSCKSWGGVHYLLTETAREGCPPLNFVLAGGQTVLHGSECLTLARAFLSEALVEIDRALSRLRRCDLAARFDGERMDSLKVPSGSWATCSDADIVAITDEVDELRELIRTGVSHRLGMLVWLE